MGGSLGRVDYRSSYIEHNVRTVAEHWLNKWMNGNLWSNINGNSQRRNKGGRRRDRNMPRDRVRGRKREKTSGQWLCGLNLGCRMTTPTIHTHTRTSTQTNTQCMSLTLLFFYCSEISMLFNHYFVVIVSTNHYWTNYQLLINYWLIPSLPCPAVLLLCVTVLTRLRCWKSVVREGKNVSSHQQTICLIQWSTTYSAFSPLSYLKRL